MRLGRIAPGEGERAAPAGVEPLHWLLWTTEPAATLDQARRVAEIYKKRWKLEEVFLALTACPGRQPCGADGATRPC